MEIYTVSCIGNLLRKYVDCSWTFATAYLVHSIKYSCQWILEMAFLGMPVLTVVSLEEKKKPKRYFYQVLVTFQNVKQVFLYLSVHQIIKCTGIFSSSSYTIIEILYFRSLKFCHLSFIYTLCLTQYTNIVTLCTNLSDLWI